jgi:hypothetical protein
MQMVMSFVKGEVSDVTVEPLHSEALCFTPSSFLCFITYVHIQFTFNMVLLLSCTKRMANYTLVMAVILIKV